MSATMLSAINFYGFEALMLPVYPEGNDIASAELVLRD